MKLKAILRRVLFILRHFFTRTKKVKPFSDLQDITGAVIFVNENGLNYLSGDKTGRIYGVMEYNHFEKAFFKLPQPIPALDFIAEINICGHNG